jgi:cation transport ATPase
VIAAAASLDQVSTHVFAGPIVGAARARGLKLRFPTAVEEEPGRGLTGSVGGQRVALGGLNWLAERGVDVPREAVDRQAALGRGGEAGVAVAIDGRLAGLLRLEDPMRQDAPAVIAGLRRVGIVRVVLVTGDHAAAAARIAEQLGVDRVLADCSPADKVAAVREEERHGATAMIGDGFNDAPALAAASVGIAVAPRGAAASAEAADAVLVADDLGRIVEAFSIARRSRRIAGQSVIAGMALSLAAMVAASAGLLPPLAGALAQEAIDLGVILNALRALAGEPAVAARTPHPPDMDRPTSRGVAAGVVCP